MHAESESGFCLQPSVQDLRSGLIPAGGGLQGFPTKSFLFILVDLADVRVDKWTAISPPFLSPELLSSTTSESQEGRAHCPPPKDGERGRRLSPPGNPSSSPAISQVELLLAGKG